MHKRGKKKRNRRKKSAYEATRKPIAPNKRVLRSRKRQLEEKASKEEMP